VLLVLYGKLADLVHNTETIITLVHISLSTPHYGLILYIFPQNILKINFYSQVKLKWEYMNDRQMFLVASTLVLGLPFRLTI